MGIDIESYVENGVEINFSLLSIEELYFWNVENKLLFFNSLWPLNLLDIFNIF